MVILPPCSSEQSWGMLVDVSQQCNVKPRDVTAALAAVTARVHGCR